MITIQDVIINATLNPTINSTHCITINSKINYLFLVTDISPKPKYIVQVQ